MIDVTLLAARSLLGHLTDFVGMATGGNQDMRAQSGDSTTQMARQAALIIRDLDVVLQLARAGKLTHVPGASPLVEELEAMRRSFFETIERLAPDEAYYWTAEWQAGEREVDGRLTHEGYGPVYTAEQFDAHLRALRPDLADL